MDMITLVTFSSSYLVEGIWNIDDNLRYTIRKTVMPTMRTIMITIAVTAITSI